MSEQEHIENRGSAGRRVTDYTPQERNNMEKHFVTIMITIVLSVLGWVAFKVTHLAEVSAAVTAEIRHLHDTNGQLRGDIREIKNDIKKATHDRFTAEDAKRMQERCQKRMDTLEAEVERIKRNGNSYNGQ